jgi:putative ABC transport system permease protein
VVTAVPVRQPPLAWWSVLARKVWRDVWHQRGPVLAIAIVVMVGVASFVALQSMVPHLRGAQQRYYATARFADVWVRVSRAPDAMTRRVADIPGVSAVETRVAKDVILEVPMLEGPATGRIMSYPVGRDVTVNRLRLRSGRLMTTAHADEVVISDGFASANSLSIGDSLGAVLNGRWRRLRVIGIALTPEFIMEVKPGALFPDNQRYGVLWMSEEVVQGAFGLQDAWNEAALTLTPGATEAAVIRRLDTLLAPYGSLGAHGRDEQVSHRYLTDEITQAATFGTAAPVIFLGVAAFLVNLVLARLVVSQREQIGMMKAFGIDNATLVRHYAAIALTPVLVGAACGSAVGLWLAGVFAELYGVYYRMPDAAFSPDWGTIAMAWLITVASAFVGAAAAVRRVSRLPAAEAMRPETPLRFRHGWIDRSWLLRRLSPTARLTVRGLFRRPVRAALATLGMALSVAVVIVGRYMFDAIAVMRDVHFTEIQREDAAVAFARPYGRDALNELAHLPGVSRVEPLWAVPVIMRHGVRERRVAISLAVPDATLRRIVDADRHVVPAPRDGLLLSAALGELLAVRVGDTVTVQVLEGLRRTARVRVDGLVEDLIGTSAWMAGEPLQRMAGASAVDGAALAIDPLRRDSAIAHLRRMPGIADIGERASVVANFDKVMRDSFYVTLMSLVGFATVLAVGVVYNTARVALSERGRELVSLRVLGFTQGEVAGMLFGELAMLAVLSIPIGIGIGTLLCAAMITALSSELFRLPFTVSLRTCAWSILVLAVSGVVSLWLVRRRLDRMDLVAVLKTRE